MISENASKIPVYRKRTRYERLLEIVPATLTWGTFAGALILSITHPAWAAVYIIVFDTYWVLKAINTTAHLLSSFNHYKHDLEIDWLKPLEMMSNREAYIKWLDERKSNVPWRFKSVADGMKKAYLAKGEVRDYRDLYHEVLFQFVDE